MKLTLEHIESSLPAPTTKERLLAVATVIAWLGVGATQLAYHSCHYKEKLNERPINDSTGRTIEYRGSK